MADWLQSWYYSTINYFMFEESSTEITRKMRLTCSNRDWIGTQQTLVLDKIWLMGLTKKFETILDSVKNERGSIIVPKLMTLQRLLGATISSYTSSEMDEVFKYFFGSKCNKTCDMMRNSSQFYADFKSHEKVSSVLDEIFTEDNVNKIQEMGIMFGFYPAIIENGGPLKT